MARSTFPALFAVLLAGSGALADPPLLEGRPAPRRVPEGLPARIWAITDTVLDNHLHPPTRQQMILAGLEAVYRAARADAPAGLARRVSALPGPEALAPLLEPLWTLSLSEPEQAGPPRRGDPIENVLLEGLLGPIDGGARLLPESERKVQEQFAGNHYVGLQIALAFDQAAKRPKVGTVMPGGPADRALVLQGDVIEEIDGVSTEGMAVGETVDRLRGALGTSVVIRVRQPNASESRTITVTRGLLPRQTVKGIRHFEDGTDEYMIDGPGAIGYVKFEDLLGSTPHELRAAVQRLDEAGARALVLDLRSLSSSNVHAAVLLADCLLEGGTIGRVRTAGRVETFQAEPDALFRDLPLAVLVDNDTSTAVLWVVAALQDNHRAAVVSAQPSVARAARGDPRLALPRDIRIARMSRNGAEVHGFVPVGDGAWSIEMITGRLERGNGRPLTLSPSPGLELPAGTLPLLQQGRGNNGEDGTAKEDEVRPGLVPDISVPLPQAAAPPRRPGGPRQPGNASEKDPNVNGDALLMAALRYLRMVSKSP
jgi:carboxyl-terminal processing protease